MAIRSLSSKLTVSKGKVAVKLACSGAACAGSMKLTVTEKAKAKHGHGKGKAAKAKKKRSVTLASGRYSLAAGAAKTFALKLGKRGRALLAKASKKHPVKATITVSVAGGETIERTVEWAREQGLLQNV